MKSRRTRIKESNSVTIKKSGSPPTPLQIAQASISANIKKMSEKQLDVCEAALAAAGVPPITKRKDL